MIKKILFGFALLATVASCTDDYTDWGQPQSNPQEDAVAFGDGSVAPVGLIDFANIPEGQEMVQVCTITAPTASDELYKPEYKIILGENEYDINANGEMSVADLESYVISTFGRRPAEREIDASLSTWVNNGSTAVKLTSGVFKITAKPEAPYISQNYYIIGEPSAWNPTETSLKFNHSSADVYDDPIFTITIPVKSAEGDDSPDKMWFAITDDVTVASGDWSDVLGCAEGNGNNSEEGKVARRPEIGNDGSFVIPVDGTAKFIKITLNMMDYSYKIEKLNFGEFIYERGNNNGWGGYTLHSPNFDGKYYGAMNLVSGFKFSISSPGWDDSGNWGTNANGDEGVLICSGSSGNINCTDGFYMITADIANLTYSLVPFTKIGIIGDGQPGGWDTDTFMTYDATEKCWVANNVTLKAGGSIKFRSDGVWNNVNIGGASLDKLVFNSNDNIPVTTDGTYTVKLYLENTAGQPYATLE